MMALKRLARASAALLMLLAIQAPAPAMAANGSQTLVIGVDHADPANQQPDQNRVFEYTDFFTRSVSVHSGDVLDFRAAPNSFHIVALAAHEQVARSVYPVALSDADDAHLAPGSGLSKIELGPSNFSTTSGSTHGGGSVAQNPFGPPVCGVAALSEALCTFSGGDDIEVAGPNPGNDPTTGAPEAVDWKIQINAAPGAYAYFCYIHPGMHGTLQVVRADAATTTQAQIDRESTPQFLHDRANGISPVLSPSSPGHGKPL